MTARYQVRGATASEISASVEARVRTGALAAGDALPPVRSLAADLGVSPATVAAAYRTLRQRGIVDTAGRNGTRVRPRPAVLGERAARRIPVPPGVLDLSTGEPDARLLPPLPPLPPLPASAPDLRDLARAALARDGVDLDGADLDGGAIAFAGGALDAIERVLGAHLRPGDRVAVEDPGWANLLDLIAALGLRAQPMAVDAEGPSPRGLRAAIDAGVRAVIVTARAQNPTGATVTAPRAAALRAILRDHPDLLLIEDDHAAQLAAEPLCPLAGATGSWAFVRSVSKPYGPDLRLAVVAGDAETIGRLEGRQRLGTGWVSTVLQRLVTVLWTSPEVAALVARAGESYDARRNALVAALRTRGFDAVGRTGINVWVPVDDETATVARLRDEGYAVAPGALYRLATPPGLRITVSRLSPGDIDPLADALARAAAGTVAPGYRA